MSFVSAAFCVIAGFALWTAYDIVAVRNSLVEARTDAARVQKSVAEGLPGSRDRDIAAAQAAADRAADRVAGAPWRISAALPFVGRPFRVVRDVTGVVHDLTHDVLPSASSSLNGVSPQELRSGNGAIDIGAIDRLRPSLTSAAQAANAAERKAALIPTKSGLSAVDAARRELERAVTDLSSLLNNASQAASLLPDMLGVTAPKTYLVGFQTNAEARGTGGLIGSFLIVRADRGRIDITRSVGDLGYRVRDPIDLGEDFDNLYGDFSATRLWQNSNLSPNFPYAAQIWRSLWRQQSGQTVDGVVAADPVALGYLLSAIGGVTLSNGQRVDQNNVVSLTESDSYATYSGRKLERKLYQTEISQKVFSSLTQGTGNGLAVIKALAKAAGEGRFAVWTADTSIQAIIASTAVGRQLPYSASPYANVIVNNAAGSKLDYYLHRSLRYTAGTCTDGYRASSIEATLVNEAPKTGLTKYVTGADSPGPPLRPGFNRVIVSAYTTWGARLTSVTVNGRPVRAGFGSELGHPVFYTVLELPPAQQTVVRFDLSEPSSAGNATMPDQPLAYPAERTVDVPTCPAARASRPRIRR